MQVPAQQVQCPAGEAQLPRVRAPCTGDAPGPAEHASDARHEFVDTEGFGHIIVGALIQPGDAVGVVGLGGQQNHWRAVVLADVSTQRKTVFARHHPIQHNQVEMQLQQVRSCLHPVAGGRDLEALPPQVSGQRIAD